MSRVGLISTLCVAVSIAACGGGAGSGTSQAPSAFAVIRATPGNDATSVATDGAIVVLFNRAPALSSVTALFSPAATASIAPAPGSAPGVAISAAGGFAPGTSYTLTVGASDENGQSLASSFVIRFSTIDLVAPARIADLAATATSSSTVRLTWTASGDDGASGTANSEDLRFASGADCPLTPANFALASQASGLPTPPHPAGTAESAVVAGLSANTTYCFAIRVLDDASNSSELSNVATATTSAIPDTTPPSAPVLTLATPGRTDVRIDFIAPGDDGSVGTASSYTLLYVGPIASCPATAADFALATALSSPSQMPAPLPAGTPQSVDVTQLAADSLYCFALAAADKAGNTSAFSAVMGATTLPPPAPPGPISDLHGTFLGTALLPDGTFGSVAQLTWTAPTAADGAVARYDIRYGTDSGCPIRADNFSASSFVFSIPTPAAPGQPESFEGSLGSTLSPGIDLCFAIVSIDSAGRRSDISNVPLLPQVVSDLRAFPAGDVSATLLFTPSFQGGTSAGKASVAVAPQIASTCPVSGLDIATAPGGQLVNAGPVAGNAASVTGLLPATVYCAAVLVTDSDGDGAWSFPSVFATTDLSPPNAPSNLHFNSVSDNALAFQMDASFDNGLGHTGVSFLYDVYFEQVNDCALFDIARATRVQFDESANITAAGQAIQIPIFGLLPGTSYCFAATATNRERNTSAFSAAILGTTSGSSIPPSLPRVFLGRVTKDLPDTGNGPQQEIQLIWSAPHDQQGAAVARYNIYVAKNANCPITAANVATAISVVNTLVPQAPQRTEELIFDFPATDTDALCVNVTATDPRGLTSPLSPSPQPSLRITSLTTTANSATSETLNFQPPVLQSGTSLGAITAFVVPSTGTCSRDSFDFTDLTNSVDATNGPATFTGLLPLTSYCAGVVVDVVPQGEPFATTFAGVGVTWSSSAAFTTGDASPPPPPLGLTATSNGDTTIGIRFAASAAHEITHTGVSSLYTVLVQPNADCSTPFDVATAQPFPVDATGTVTNEGDPVVTTLTGLTFATRYCLTVVAQNLDGELSIRSGGLRTSTAGPPLPVTTLHATDIFDTTDAAHHFAHALDLQWIASSDFAGNPLPQLDVRVGLNGDCPITEANFATLPALDASVFSSLPPGAHVSLGPAAALDTDADQQCFAMVGVDSNGRRSAISNVAAPPRRIVQLQTATDGVSATAATVAFTGTTFLAGTSPGSYLVTYAATTQPCIGAFVKNLPGAVTFDAGAAGPSSVVLSGLTPSTAYCMSIDVEDADGDDSFSPGLTFTTLDGSAPTPPASLSVTGSTATSLDIQFSSSAASTSPSAGVATTYLVDVQALSDCSQFESNGGAVRATFDESGVVTAPGQTVHATAGGLSPATHYCVAVEAQNGSGTLSGHSAVVEVTTAQ